MRTAPALPAAPADTRARNLALLSAAHAVTHSQQALYAMVYPQVMRAFGVGYAQLGVLIGAANLVGGLLQGAYGALSRRVRRTSLCGGGNMLVGLSLALAALAHAFPGFAAGRVLGSAAASQQHPAGASLMSDWYRRGTRGSAFAVHFSGGNVGTLLTPLLAGALVSGVGWRGTMMLFGIPGLVVGLLLWLLAEDPRPGGEEARRCGEETGYLAALRDHNVRMLLLGRAASAGGRGLGVVLTYVPLYLISGLHLSTATAGAYVTILAAGSVLSPVLAGRLADRLGRRRPVIAASLWASALATLWLVHAGRWTPGILASLVALGLAVYNESPLMQALLAEVTGDRGREGAFSVFFVNDNVSGAVWSAVLGFVIARWHFAAAFAAMAVSYLLASIAVLLVREGPA